MEEVICRCPRKFQLTEEGWIKLLNRWKETGKTIGAQEVREMFPEQYEKE